MLAPTAHILMAAARTMEYSSPETFDSDEEVLTLEVVNEGIAGLAACEGGQKRGNITRCICALVLVVQTFLLYHLAVLAFEGLGPRSDKCPSPWQTAKDDTSLILLAVAGYVHCVNVLSRATWRQPNRKSCPCTAGLVHRSSGSIANYLRPLVVVFQVSVPRSFRQFEGHIPEFARSRFHSVC